MARLTGKEWLTLKEASELTGKSLNAVRLLVHRKKIDGVKKVQEQGRSYWVIHRDALGQLSGDLPKVKEGDVLRVKEGDAPNAKCELCTLRKNGGDPAICAEICLADPDIGDALPERPDIYHRQEDQESPDERHGSEMLEASVDGEKKRIYVVEDETLPSQDDLVEPSVPLEHYERRQKEWEKERDGLMQGLMMYRFKFEELDRKMKVLPAPPEYVSAKIEELESQLAEESREKDVLVSELGNKLTTLFIDEEKNREHYETRVKDYEHSLAELKKRLEEEERAKEALRCQMDEAMHELRERRKPWWKKVLRTGAKKH
ncbi:MAG: helix-turn-helix domain-containing protein [Candidatus Eremiobacteraeota bacterium]|nr:helix-turn-helix domain-containing protein [Candidatus Eremiobacteraeota bacterium]